MIVTILWEDERGPTQGFGPEILLIQCVKDRLPERHAQVKRLISSTPQKGVSNLLKTLRNNWRKLADNGPVYAVIDRDKIHRELPGQTPTCLTGMRNHILASEEERRAVDLVFLIENVESLIAAMCTALEQPVPSSKPTPAERDRYFAMLTWDAPPQKREEALKLCPSFARLVERVAKSVSETKLSP